MNTELITNNLEVPESVTAENAGTSRRILQAGGALALAVSLAVGLGVATHKGEIAGGMTAISCEVLNPVGLNCGPASDAVIDPMHVLGR